MRFTLDTFTTTGGHAFRPLSLMDAPIINWTKARFEHARSRLDVSVERNGRKWRVTRHPAKGARIAPGVLTSQDWRELKTYAEAWAVLLSLPLAVASEADSEVGA